MTDTTPWRIRGDNAVYTHRNVRFDTRKIPFYKCVGDVTKWWETYDGYTIPDSRSRCGETPALFGLVQLPQIGDVQKIIEECGSFSLYSETQLPTTTQKIIVKMEFDEIRESRRIRKWKEGFGEETETSMGWLSHRLFKPLGGVVSSPIMATLKLRMMPHTPDPASDNQGSDAV